MIIAIEQKVLIYWKATCNSEIDGTVACKLPTNIIQFESAYPPQIGEIINFPDYETSYTVKSVKREVTFGATTEEKFIIGCQAKTMTVDYYDYMKKHYHCCDDWKADDDPTKDLSKLHDPVVLPSTWSDWLSTAKAAKALVRFN